jgi:hypothetical protein
VPNVTQLKLLLRARDRAIGLRSARSIFFLRRSIDSRTASRRYLSLCLLRNLLSQPELRFLLNRNRPGA